MLAKAKGSLKEKVLELYAHAVQKEQAKLKKLKVKKKVRFESSDSESDASVNVVHQPMTLDDPIKKKNRKKPSSPSDQTEEEKAFLQKVMHLDENSSSSDGEE